MVLAGKAVGTDEMLGKDVCVPPPYDAPCYAPTVRLAAGFRVNLEALVGLGGRDLGGVAGAREQSLPECA